MPDTTYRVVLALSTTGNLDAKVGDLGAKASVAHGHLDRLGEAGRRMGEMVSRGAERMGEALERAADHAFELAKHVGEIGLAAGLAAAAYGVAHLNRELEETNLSLATVFQTQGFASSFTGAMKLSADQIAKMKQDVKSLPGDLGQLSDIMKMIATPAAQGGATPDQIRALAGRGMLVSRILGVPQEVASRELAQLFAGRAGSHNILGGRLGLIGENAQRFNKESAQDRVKEITNLFNTPAMNAAAGAFANTWVAQITTLADNVKYLMLAPATSGLFERVKHAVGEINEYIDEHKHQIEAVASTVNRRLVAAWDKIEEIVKRLAPVVGRMFDKLLMMQPSQIGNHLMHGAEELAGLKIAGMGLSGLGGGLRIASAIGAMGGGEALGGLAATALPALGVAAATAIPAMVAAAGAFDILKDKTSIYHDEAVKTAEDIGSTWGRVGENLSTAIEPAESAAGRLTDKLGILALEGLDKCALYAERVSIMLVDVTNGFKNLLDVAKYGFGHGDALKKFRETQPEELEHPTIDKNIDDIVSGALAYDRRTRGATDDGASPKKGAGGGGGGTHIAKVEIVVQGNSDPSRVARLTLAELQKIARNPTSSPMVPNFQQAGH